MRYPVEIKKDTSGYSVSFPDIPEALTCGDTIEEAREMAQDALETALEFYFEQNRAVPVPSKPKKGQEIITLPASLWAKVLLLNEMLAQKVGPSELGRRIAKSPQDVNRLMNLKHPTKIDAISTAVTALGKHLNISVA